MAPVLRRTSSKPCSKSMDCGIFRIVSVNWAALWRRETGQGVLGGSGADERQFHCRPFAAGAAPHHMSAMPYHRFKVGQTVVAPFGGPHALIRVGRTFVWCHWLMKSNTV